MTTTYWQDTLIYVGRMRVFQPIDWRVYFLWVGLISSLFFLTLSVLLIGSLGGAPIPVYAWNIPLGAFIFSAAIAVDTIGHRTVYAEALRQGESLVHHITIAAGISSVVLLCIGYTYFDFCRIPAWVMTFLSIFYSGIDEAMHWIRFAQGNSDRIEMWSHFFIFVGHILMVSAWVYYFEQGYPGLAETIALISGN